MLSEWQSAIFQPNFTILAEQSWDKLYISNGEAIDNL